MDEKTCFKYLQFLRSELDRYQKNNMVKDDNLLQLTAEVTRFKEQVAASALHADIRSAISQLKFNYTPGKAKMNTAMTILVIISFGSGYLLYRYLEQQKRKGWLTDLGTQVDGLLAQLRFLMA